MAFCECGKRKGKKILGKFSKIILSIRRTIVCYMCIQVMYALSTYERRMVRSEEMSTTTINARIDLNCKKEAQEVLEKLGLSMSGAIEMFFKQIVLQQGLPFDVKLPNQDTARAMEELEANEGAKFSSIEELFEDLEN